MDWNAFQFEPEIMLVVMARLLVACFLGGVIGFEREYSRHKPAGFRTHILVSLGSCLVVLISQFAIMSHSGAGNVDPTRIAAQVVSGIGFLGAGAIIRHGTSVKGITTAASVWAVACVGLACGFGFYIGAILATILIWAVLMYLKVIEDKLTFKGKLKIVEIDIQTGHQILYQLGAVFKEAGLEIKSLEVSDNQSENKQRAVYQLECTKNTFDFTSLTTKIKDIEGVLRVSL